MELLYFMIKGIIKWTAQQCYILCERKIFIDTYINIRFCVLELLLYSSTDIMKLNFHICKQQG